MRWLWAILWLDFWKTVQLWNFWCYTYTYTYTCTYTYTYMYIYNSVIITLEYLIITFFLQRTKQCNRLNYTLSKFTQLQWNMTSNREAPFWHLVFSSYKQFGGVHLWVKLYEKLETHNKGLGLFIFTNVQSLNFYHLYVSCWAQEWSSVERKEFNSKLVQTAWQKLSPVFSSHEVFCYWMF